MAVTTCKQWWFVREEDSIFVIREVNAADGAHTKVQNLLINISMSLLQVNTRTDTEMVQITYVSSSDGSQKKMVFPLKTFAFGETPFSNKFRNACRSAKSFVNVWDRHKEFTCGERNDQDGASTSTAMTTAVRLENSCSDQDNNDDEAMEEESTGEENADIDACNTFDKKRLTEFCMLPVKHLQEPASSRRLRKANKDHVAQLQEYFVKSQRPNLTSTMLINIPTTESVNQIDLKKVKEGRYKLEVIGGNHTRIALQNIIALPAFEDKPEFTLHGAEIYVGLTAMEALLLGREHNDMHGKEHGCWDYDFGDQVRTCRSIFGLIAADTDNYSRVELTNWRQQLCIVFNVTRPELRTKFKRHTFLAMQHSSVWTKLDLAIERWGAGTINGQPKSGKSSTLNNGSFNFLSDVPPKERKAELESLLQGKTSYPELRKKFSKRRDIEKPNKKASGKNQACSKCMQLQKRVCELEDENKKLEQKVLELSNLPSNEISSQRNTNTTLEITTKKMTPAEIPSIPQTQDVDSEDDIDNLNEKIPSSHKRKLVANKQMSTEQGSSMPKNQKVDSKRQSGRRNIDKSHKEVNELEWLAMAYEDKPYIGQRRDGNNLLVSYLWQEDSGMFKWPPKKDTHKFKTQEELGDGLIGIPVQIEEVSPGKYNVLNWNDIFQAWEAEGSSSDE